MIDFQVAFRWAWKCPRKLLLQKIYDSMIFRFSGLWQIKILKGSDIGPEIKSEAELGAGTLVLFQNFSQALAAKAQGVSDVRVFGGPSLFRLQQKGKLNSPPTGQWVDNSFFPFKEPLGFVPRQDTFSWNRKNRILNLTYATTTMNKEPAYALCCLKPSKTFRSISGRPEKPRSEFVL